MIGSSLPLSLSLPLPLSPYLSLFPYISHSHSSVSLYLATPFLLPTLHHPVYPNCSPCPHTKTLIFYLSSLPNIPKMLTQNTQTSILSPSLPTPSPPPLFGREPMSNQARLKTKSVKPFLSYLLACLGLYEGALTFTFVKLTGRQRAESRC
jgi:hypothetical protein